MDPAHHGLGPFVSAALAVPDQCLRRGRYGRAAKRRTRSRQMNSVGLDLAWGSQSRYEPCLERLVRLGQALLEGFELVLDAGGQLVADELEPLLDQRQFVAPLGGLDR
jgi:hypothetical protein